MEYDFKAIESKWREYWAKTGIFKTPARPIRSGGPASPLPELTAGQAGKKKYYLLEMFAYPSGDIHIGHFRNYAMGDAYYRYKKMCGYDLLHPFGWDAFGLPAEEAAIKNKLHPRNWTLNNITTSRTTLQDLSISYDWDREVITCQPDYYKWTQWIFLLLYKRGLAYQADSFVNWCPGCKTVLANEQVDAQGQCWRCHSDVGKRNLKQWFFKITDYAERLLKDIDKLTHWPENIKTMQRNWIGRSEGTEIQFPIANCELRIGVFTTRPDTIYGVTFMAIAPEHPLVEKLVTPEQKDKVAAYVKQALAKSEIDRASADEKDGVFTGSYAVNPLSGEQVQLWVTDYVLVHYGTGIVMGVPAHDQRDFLFARKYNIPIKVVINPPAKTLSPETMTEAYADEGVMTNSGPFNGLPSAEGIGKVTEYVRKKGLGEPNVHYRLKDWLLSRQRYWGAPIPMVHCPKCNVQPVPESDLPVLLPEDVKDFIPKGRSPLADVKKFMDAKCPKCGGPAQRDPDTMDTFVCSSWYHLRYTDPKNTKEPFSKAEAAKWLPIDTYIGGSEHACGHLIYFRFITKVLYDAGWVNVDEPAVRLFNQGMVMDEKGEVMSKSKGNAVSPIDLMNTQGMDASRLAIFFAGPSETEMVWSDQVVVGARRFINRLYQLVESLPPATAEAVGDTRKLAAAAEMSKLYRKMHLTIKEVTEDIEQFHFNTALSKIMELVNNIYDVKNLLRHPTRAADMEGVKGIIRKATRVAVQLIAPLAPHLAEELWEKLSEQNSIFNQAWLKHDPSALEQEKIELVIQVNGKVRSHITVPSGTAEDEIKKQALADEKVQQILKGAPPKKVILIPGRLVNIVG
ncbi:MAG: leucine--tRNA ligase [Planctomycetes bacterium]|nr:leucine--tRNA ligase [Planctomycetota bacterium]